MASKFALTWCLFHLMVVCHCGVASDSNSVNQNQVQSKINTSKSPLSTGSASVKDLSVDATITHTSDPAPEFYRGSPNVDIIRDRAYDATTRYGSSDYSKPNNNWLSLDRDALYKNPYIANAYNKLTSSTPSPSVSSLTAPNSSYRDRNDYYNQPTANEYLNSKYGGSYGATGYGLGYNGAVPYGPPQAIDYSGFGNQGPAYDGYGIRPHLGPHVLPFPDGGGYGHGHSVPDFHGFSKFSKSALLPLAGAALLGVAATLVANPLLLNLGIGKRRRRRRSAVNSQTDKQDDSGQTMAYRGYRTTD